MPSFVSGLEGNRVPHTELLRLRVGRALGNVKLVVFVESHERARKPVVPDAIAFGIGKPHRSVSCPDAAVVAEFSRIDCGDRIVFVGKLENAHSRGRVCEIVA